MRTTLRVLLFLALVVAWLEATELCGMAPWSGVPAFRLHAMFACGAWLAVFYEGDSFGAMPPVSTRPLWIVLGCVLMGASTLWMYAIGSVIKR